MGMLGKWRIVAIRVIGWTEDRGLGCFGVLVMNVMLLCVDLFMLLEILGSLESFAAYITIMRF